MVEGDQHKKAVARYKDILQADGWQILANDDSRGERGFRFPTMATDKGPIGWVADFCAEKNGRRVICEVDGKKPGQGHFTSIADSKRAFRTRFFETFFGIKTTAIDTDVLVGKKKQDDEIILAEFYYQTKIPREVVAV